MFKPYVKKPMIHTPREQEVLANTGVYMIRTVRGTRVLAEAYTHDIGQVLAALLKAREMNVRCLTYAVGELYGEEAFALIDEEEIRKRMP